ncbi:GDSL-type esterase/lipase family protein [uncultured Mailhella sp.]|uniref:SGNH/GDSL hydrolase family protein n=1 Tax=uncultured Mailhella sp. TaxID=1981031 RepID=UPI00262939A1|nr:GDSL-type esterase/lipase family protein [uncultured Mailhella sp.]
MKLCYFFGDSVTLGVNDAPAGGWVARFAGKAEKAGLLKSPDTFYNLGVRRHSSRMILERWEAEYRSRAMEGVPAYLLFCFGIVDMAAPRGAMNIPIGESAACARDILQGAGAYGSVALMSAPPVKDAEHNQRLGALCTAYAAICAAVGALFIDVYHPLMQGGYLDDLSDGVHPGAAGNEQIANLLVQSPVVFDWLGEKSLDRQGRHS